MRLALVATASVIALAAALPAPASDSAPNRTLTIRLVSTPGKTTFRDVWPKGLGQGLPTRGDLIRGTSILRNAAAQFGKAKGAVVGGDTYSMRFRTAALAVVSVTARLPDGAIQAKGTGDITADRLTIAVVGGTGAYVGARGTSESKSLAGNRSLNVYRLRLP